MVPKVPKVPQAVLPVFGEQIHTPGRKALKRKPVCVTMSEDTLQILRRYPGNRSDAINDIVEEWYSLICVKASFLSHGAETIWSLQPEDSGMRKNIRDELTDLD